MVYAVSEITPVTLSGDVIQGNQKGREIGFPTANLDVTIPQSLQQGIYFATVTFQQQPFYGLVYIGPNYAQGLTELQCEVYIYDFSDDIYDQPLTITLTHFMRPPIKFTTLEEVQKQLVQDKHQGLIIQKSLAS